MAKGMKAVKRVTKKELKEDKFVTTYFQVRKYLEEHQKIAWRIAGGIVLVIAIISFMVRSKSRSETQAANELSSAVLAAQTGDPEAVVERFTQIADRYKGTQSGDEALFYIAQFRGLQHRPEEALKAYDDFLKRGHRRSYLYPAALAGKAVALEDLKRYPEAAEMYLKAAQTQEDQGAGSTLYLDAGRCYRSAGDQAKARVQYDYVIRQFPRTASAQNAEKYLAQLSGN